MFSFKTTHKEQQSTVPVLSRTLHANLTPLLWINYNLQARLTASLAVTAAARAEGSKVAGPSVFPAWSLVHFESLSR